MLFNALLSGTDVNDTWTMEHKGALQSLRIANTESVLRCVEMRPSAQAEIAVQTGLSAALVSSIVHQLVAEGAVETTPGTRSGRRATIVSVASTPSGTVVGVALERDGFRIATWAGSALQFQSFPWQADFVAQDGSVRPGGLGQVESHLSTLTSVSAVALSAPGWASVRAKRPHLASTTMALPHWWAPQSAAEDLGTALGCEVLTLNDANAAAHAEFRMGSAQGLNNFIYLYLAGGIGGALFMDGKAVDGDSGFAGELGHIQVSDSGPRCRCGNRGCLELVIGEQALMEPLRQRSPEMASAKLNTLIDLAVAGDPFSARSLAEAGEDIGRVVAQMLRFLDMRNIIVGGLLAEAGDVIIRPLADQLSRHSAFQPYQIEDPLVPVRRAQLGLNASALGAMLKAAEHIGMRSVPDLKNAI
jgi:predicted NBD/HSP70 family sugar kinase